MDLNFKPGIEASPAYVGGASIEAIQQKYGLEEIVKIGSNESPLGPSPLAIEAMQQATSGLNRYPPWGDDELRAALAERLNLAADNFFTGNGGCDVLDMLALGFLSPGDECIICRPTFPIYDLTARRVGSQVVYVDLDPEHFTYDIEAMLGAVTEQTRLLYVCSPNNPTGNIMPAEQMETLVNNLPPHVLLVTDEVYNHFVTDQNHHNSLEYVRQGKNVVILHSFSKAFSLAGLRLGYGIAPTEIADYMARVRKPFHLSRVTLAGGLAALGDRAHLEKVIETVVAGRQWLYEQLSDMAVRVWLGQANFLLFQVPGVKADVMAQQLEQRGVIVRPMTNFYLPDHLRVSVGLPAENERFIAALGQVLV